MPGSRPLPRAVTPKVNRACPRPSAVVGCRHAGRGYRRYAVHRAPSRRAPGGARRRGARRAPWPDRAGGSGPLRPPARRPERLRHGSRRGERVPARRGGRHDGTDPRRRDGRAAAPAGRTRGRAVQHGRVPDLRGAPRRRPHAHGGTRRRGWPAPGGPVPVCGKGMRSDDYDKLDVEPAYLARGGTVLRLAMIYGPHDPQRREQLVLRRVRAGRTRIPIGPAATLLTRLHVDDTARAILAALDQPSVAAGQVFNIGEAQAYSVRAWMRLILDAAGHSAELVRVPEESLPADLGLTRTHAQHLLLSSRKAMDLLGWRPLSRPGAMRSWCGSSELLPPIQPAGVLDDGWLVGPMSADDRAGRPDRARWCRGWWRRPMRGRRPRYGPRLVDRYGHDEVAERRAVRVQQYQPAHEHPLLIRPVVVLAEELLHPERETVWQLA